MIIRSNYNLLLIVIIISFILCLSYIHTSFSSEFVVDRNILPTPSKNQTDVNTNHTIFSSFFNHSKYNMISLTSLLNVYNNKTHSGITDIQCNQIIDDPKKGIFGFKALACDRIVFFVILKN